MSLLSSASSLQFLRELHFIEAGTPGFDDPPDPRLQFLRELHFIEARSSRGLS